MSTGKMKILVVVVLVFLNFIAVVKILDNSSDEANANRELEIALSTARDYKKQNLCNAALQYYRKSLQEEDSLETRKEMMETYDAGLVNGEISSQQIIDDFLVSTVDERWKDSATYEFALDYSKVHENQEMMVAILNRATENKISSDGIKKYYSELSKKCSISDAKFACVSYSDNNWFCVSDGEKYGYVNQWGENVVDFQYDYATPFFDGYAILKSDNFVYLADTSFVRWNYFSNLISSSSGLGNGILSATDGVHFTYYSTGEENNSYKTYDYAGKFYNGLAAVKEGEQWSLINADGKEVSKSKYTEIALNNREECVNNGVIFVKDKVWHIMNSELEIIADFDCEDLDITPTGDLFAYMKDGKWGFANYQGEVVIQPQYEDAKAFSYGYAGVKKDGKWGFIDSNNVFQMEGNYQDVLYFTDSKTCFVKINDLWTVITKLL